MRRGTTLIELLLALAILGLLTGAALPAIGMARDRALVWRMARQLASAHADTRTASWLSGARAELTLTPTGYQLQQWNGTSFVPAWTRPGPAAEGVTLTGSATPLVFDSRGYSLGAANRTYQLARGGASRRVVISRLGRLRILP